MNNKFLFGMFTAAGMLLATSCQNDELEGIQSGNKATVSFTLGVENGVQTRAISDGTKADKLVYAVFNEKNERISTIAQVTETGIDDLLNIEGHKVDITLAKGQTYKIAFWAQDEDCEAYSISDDMKVAIDYRGGNNDENRDAFFANVEFTVEGHANIDVTLKRPFAQINLGVTDEDWNAAIASGINIHTSSVVVKNAATSINLLTGEASGETEVAYALAEIPMKSNEVLAVDLNGDGTIDDEEKFNYLSMSYILVNDETANGAAKATLQDLDFTFHPESGNDIVFGEGLNSVPVQRNWRTNIVGQILTGNIHFTIKIDPIYDGEYDFIIEEDNDHDKTFGVKASSGKQYQTLAEALNAGEKEIKLANGEYSLDVNFNQDVTITGVDKENVKVNIPKSIYGNQWSNSLTLKNLTTSVPKNLVYSEASYAFIHRINSFTMENCKSDGRLRLNVNNASINNCEFNVDVKNGFDGYAIYQYGGNNSIVKVNNSTFNTVGKAIVLYSESNPVLNLDVNNCTFVSSDATTDKAAIQMHTEYGISGTVNIANSTATGFLDVNGGLWNEINNQTGAKTDYFTVNVTSGNGAITNGTYTIYNSGDLSGIEDILAAGYGNATIDIQSDITTTATNFLHTQDATSDVTIKGNGKTITSYAESSGDFQWDATEKIAKMSTIFATTGDNKLVANDLKFTGTMSALMLGIDQAQCKEGEIELNNVSVVDAKVVDIVFGYAPAVCIYNRNTTLKNCVVTGTTVSSFDGGTAEKINDVLVAGNGMAVVNGGQIGSVRVYKNATLKVTGNAVIETIVPETMNSTVSIEADAKVSILDLSGLGTSKATKITIKEGASVEKIIDANGSEYATIDEFNARQSF